MNKVALLAELRALAADMPDLVACSSSSRIHHEWLGKAYALISRWNQFEAQEFKISTDYLFTLAGNPAYSNIYVGKLLAILHRALADLELQVPELSPQAFGPGAVYDFYKTLRELLASATKALLIIDPYLNDQVFDAYISSVSPQVVVRLLAGKHAPSLALAVQRFIAQNNMTVEVRISHKIHDRVIFIDDSSCWVLGQSIKDAAEVKPTYLAPLPLDTSRLKKAVYERIWTAATPI
jgi:hypothetical protein